MFFKKSRRTLRSIVILGSIQLLAVGILSYIGYRYVLTSAQQHIPKQLDSIASSYQEIVGEPLPENAQTTIKKINDFLKPSTSPSLPAFSSSWPKEREPVSTVPSHPFGGDNKQLDTPSEYPNKRATIQSWINSMDIDSVVFTDSGNNNRAIIEQKTYHQGDIINHLYQLKWSQTTDTPDGTLRLYFSTPEGDIYTKDF